MNYYNCVIDLIEEYLAGVEFQEDDYEAATIMLHHTFVEDLEDDTSFDTRLYKYLEMIVNAIPVDMIEHCFDFPTATRKELENILVTLKDLYFESLPDCCEEVPTIESCEDEDFIDGILAAEAEEAKENTQSTDEIIEENPSEDSVNTNPFIL